MIGGRAQLLNMMIVARSVLSLRMSTAATAKPPLASLSAQLAKISHLSRAKAVVEWDQMVCMPGHDDTASSRGNSLAALAGVIHDMSTSHELGDMIAKAEHAAAKGEITEARDLAVVREARRDYDSETKISSELASRRALLSAAAYSKWTKARGADDYSVFADTLADCFGVVKEVAEARREDPSMDIYDVCLDEYERGMEASRIQEIFDQVETALTPLIQSVLAAPNQPSESPLQGHFPIDAQEELNRAVVVAMGFDTERGRIDTSVHPFTTSFGPADVRITSRFSETEWYQGLAGSVHECGHALVPNPSPMP